MKKRIVGILVCLLFFGVSVVSGINDGIGIKHSPCSILGLKNEDRHPLMEPYSGETQYISRKKMITIAEAYADHEWYPTVENEFHGFCNYCNKQVHTPDSGFYPSGWIVGQKNIGVPYQWGGFSSLSGLGLSSEEDFDEQYTGTGEYSGIIHYGGDIWIENNECSRACGVDCSGFVSRCWNLPSKQSTSTLPWVSNQIKFDSLKPGDVFDEPGFHVILFKEFVNDEKTLVRTIEANFPRVYENVYNAEVSQDGYFVTLDNEYTYQIYSYKNIINSAPDAPTISGPYWGKAGTAYTFKFTSTDIDEDAIAEFIVNWGDTGYVTIAGPSPASSNHTWSSDGTYTIMAKARDIYGAESDWGYYVVIMPKNKNLMHNTLLKSLFERFPNLFPVLRQLLGY